MESPPFPRNSFDLILSDEFPEDGIPHIQMELNF